MAIFKTGRNFKSNTGHFDINFEYKILLNFGGNFLKKKVSLIVRKILNARIIMCKSFAAKLGCFQTRYIKENMFIR